MVGLPYCSGQLYYTRLPSNETIANKMADKRIFVIICTLLSVLPFITALLLNKLLLLHLLIAKKHEQVQLMLNAATQYNSALARLRYVKRRVIRRRRRLRRQPGRTDQWWRNLCEGRAVESEWKKNFQLNRCIFMNLADEVRPFSRGSSWSARRRCLVGEEAIGDDFILPESMTANAFGVAICTVSVVIRKVCHVLINKCGRYIKLPTSEQEIMKIVTEMENKFGFPQAFGCVDGTHIPILSPNENPHDYFCYKMKYTLNVQALCDYN